MSANQIARKLGEIKQYQSKIPKNVILQQKNEIYEILGGVHSILEHYVSNARYLKLYQVNQLHEFLQTTKEHCGKRQMQKRRKRAAGSGGGSAALLQSRTPLCNSSDDARQTNTPGAPKRQPLSRKRAATTQKPRKRLQARTQTQTNALGTPSLPSARSKSSQPRTRKHLQTQSQVQSKSRTPTNERGSASSPDSHSKPPSFGPSKSFESKHRTDKKKVHQYQPIFGAKTEQNAHRRQDKREHKRRGSGLAERMRIERSELHNEEASPVKNRYKQTVRNKYTKPQQKEHNLRPRGNTKPKMRKMYSSNSDTTVGSPPHVSQQTVIVHAYDDIDPMDDHELNASDPETPDVTTTHKKDEWDEDDGSRLRYDKKRRYSISEYTDWCNDNDENEIQQSNDYFLQLQKQYAHKDKKHKHKHHKKHKKHKKNKKKKKARKQAKMDKLKRMAMEQMKREKSQQKTNPQQKKELMSAMDALHSVLNNEDSEDDSKEHHDEEMEGQPGAAPSVESIEMERQPGAETESDDETVQKEAAVPTYEEENVNPNNNYLNPNSMGSMAMPMGDGKGGIDSPEFLAFFDKFMSDNCSFYVSGVDSAVHSQNEDSDISSMENDSHDEEEEVYHQNITY
eukprot:548668_1